MNENTSNKTNRHALGLAILVAVAGFTAAGLYFRHSHQLQVRLDATTKELQQTKSDLAKIQQPAAGLSELETARLKLASMMAHGLAQDHPAVREQAGKIAKLQK